MENMKYLDHPIWEEYYKELDPEKRWKLYEEIIYTEADDGANALRKELFQWRYTDPKKPGKRVDKGIWEMVVMPAHMSGFIAFRSRIQQHIDDSLKSLRMTKEIKNDDVLLSAVYWEMRNIARRFYDTCKSSQYGRKLFGMKESTWPEKQIRCAHDVWTMAEIVPEKFDRKNEMQIFSDAVIDEFYILSEQSQEIYEDVRVKLKRKRFPIVI
ncbi:MAG: hypothetical protein Q4E53_02385 [Eubacteriales bacterium]|nr:hypothetical protein [Eubacteriales bacterium]